MNAVQRDLVDPFGRVIRDLRISVTDRCNFRCTYCMPEEGMEWLDRDDVLSFEEIERISALFVQRFGVEGIRLTGGEPTVRAGIVSLVEKLSHLGVDLAMTTNASRLTALAGDLKAAGLRRLNISLDTLDRSRFAEMTRRDELDRVLAGIDAARDAGFDPVKVNAVIERGVNDDEIVDLARFGRERGVEVRFIEFMPLDASGEWGNDKVVGQDEIVEAINAV
jgi:cyclic pyranopterin phosphate synthase